MNDFTVGTFEVFTTVAGNAVVGDANDEGAPLIKLEFCNELKHISEFDKLRIAKAAAKEALRILNGEQSEIE